MLKQVVIAAAAAALLSVWPLAPAAAQSAAPASPAASGTAKPAAKSAAKPSPGRAAAIERQKKCGAEWKATKAAGKVEKGMTWPKFWSACNKRLKESKT